MVVWAKRASHVMNDEEAILQLVAGTEDEREQALTALFERYHAGLAVAAARNLFVDEQAASSGAAMAFVELRELAARADQNDDKAKKAVTRLMDGSGRVKRWLLTRTLDRTVDELRNNRRLVSGIPNDEKDQVVSVELDSNLEPGGREPEPDAGAMTGELRGSALEFLESLDGIDRGILLHDLVFRYELLTEAEAEQFDEELVSRSDLHGDYTDAAIKKRRQRLTERLRAHLTARRHT